MNSLYKFLSWFCFLVAICFYGITNTYAAEYIFDYSYTQTYYNNNGSSLNNVGSTWNESLQAYVSNNINTIADSYGGGVSILSPIPILQNHSYTISFAFEDRSNMALSSKNRISIGTSASNSANNYANSDYKATMLYSKVSNNTVFSFAFKSTINGTYIFIPFTTTSNKTQNYVMTKVNIEDLGSEGVSQQDIDNSINSQTTILQNQITDLQNGINSSINDMGEDITNSIDNNFNKKVYCSNIWNEEWENGYYNRTTGVKGSGNTYIRSTDYISLDSNETNLYFSKPSQFSDYAVLFYDNSKQLIEFAPTYTTSRSFIIPNNAKYFTFYLSQSSGTATYNNNIMINYGSTPNSYCQYGSYTETNRIDETNQKLDDLNNNLTDTNVDTSGLNNAVGWLPQGPVDSIINLPLSMFSAMLNALGKTCTPLSVPLPYVNSNLTIPCLSSIFNQIDGVYSFWTWVGTIASVLILYNYLLSLYKWVDDTLTMRENTMPGYYDSNFGGGY